MRWFVFIIGLFFTAVCAAQPFDHVLWDALLKQHVIEIDDGRASQVDYAGFANDRAELEHYLEQLAAVERPQFDAWPQPEQLAFLINAYNAWTVNLILTAYPGLDSIKDLGSFLRSPWKKDFIPLFGDSVSLDHIEHDLIRGSGEFNEPRIHFAVNCASIGCPALRNEAYTAENLEQQLQQQTELFLADRSRNYLENGVLKLSPIFKWYRQDFEQGWRGTESLAAFLSLYAVTLALTPEQKSALQAGKLKIGFTDYDWRLNDKS